MEDILGALSLQTLVNGLVTGSIYALIALGLTLIFGVLAFVGVLFGMRLLYRPIHRALMRRHRDEKPFYARLLAALFYLATSIFAVLATLVVQICIVPGLQRFRCPRIRFLVLFYLFFPIFCLVFL